MAGCGCAPRRTVVIETTVLRVEGETCERCGAMIVNGELHESYSVEHIREAVMHALGAVLSGGSCC